MLFRKSRFLTVLSQGKTCNLSINSLHATACVIAVTNTLYILPLVLSRHLCTCTFRSIRQVRALLFTHAAFTVFNRYISVFLNSPVETVKSWLKGNFLTQCWTTAVKWHPGEANGNICPVHCITGNHFW